VALVLPGSVETQLGANHILHAGSYPLYISWFLNFRKVSQKMWELWGVEILAFPLTRHISYTTSCC